jgi:taurine dioxygenase
MEHVMEIRSLGTEGFAAEIDGFDFASAAGADAARAVLQALVDHSVICLRSEGLQPAQFLDLARLLGTPKTQLIADDHHPDHEEISFVDSSKTDRLGDGKRIIAGINWHTDDSYLQRPCWATMLYADIIPESGGDTLFCDMYGALAALPDDIRRRIEGRSAGHAYFSRRNLTRVPRRTAAEEAASPNALHPLVVTHHLSGRQALYLNPNRIEHIVGMSDDDADPLLDELYRLATDDRFVYRHRWRRHDVVIWDNRCTMHKASADYGDEPRRMWRILLQGEPPQ